MTPRILASATGRSKLIEAEMVKTVGETSFRGKTEFSFRHTHFEISTRHPTGDVDSAVGYESGLQERGLS